MERANLLARLLRALSGENQETIAQTIGVHHSLIAHWEAGRSVPNQAHLKGLAAAAGITLRDAEELLRLYEAFHGTRETRSRSAEEVLDRLAHDVRNEAEAAFRRILRLPQPSERVVPEDRRRAAELWARLEALPDESQSALIRVAEEFQSWALCERVCEESVTETSRDVERVARLARLASEIANRVPGPKSWRTRVRGYAMAHVANADRVRGDLAAAEAHFAEAESLWNAGADPAFLLDPGRIFNLQAVLRRDQRRFPEALAAVEKAEALCHRPELALIQKGFTLEVMGEYQRAVETLLHAEPLVEGQDDLRLYYMLRFNLAVNYCHLERYEDAAGLLERVRELATARGDANEVLRVTWLEGRIAAGLGRSGEGLALLAQAREGFAARGMDYDAALALLEEAALLLDAGRTAEVSALTEALQTVFESKGVHREALAALRLFQEAAERREATAGLARRVLAYLFRARHDWGLRFSS